MYSNLKTTLEAAAEEDTLPLNIAPPVLRRQFGTDKSTQNPANLVRDPAGKVMQNCYDLDHVSNRDLTRVNVINPYWFLTQRGSCKESANQFFNSDQRGPPPPPPFALICGK